jgi:hypothetical protein
MKTKIFLTGILGIVLIVGCAEGDKFDLNKKVIYVTGADVDPLVRFVVENTPAVYTVTASVTDKVTEKTIVTFAHDVALVAAYNETNKANYYPIPASAIEIDGTQGVIEAGQAASTGITVRVVSIDDFEEGRIYMIPITIKSVQGGDMEVLNPSKTIYLRISRPVGFPSLDISSYNMYANAIFPADKKVELEKYTYEIKCYVNDFHPTRDGRDQISRLCNFCPEDESITNLLRFSENDKPLGSLQWMSPVGELLSKTIFKTEQWYTISLTFDGNNYAMYVDGVKDVERAGEKGTTFQRLELGMSWGSGYPNSQRFLGRIAEIRLWNRALSTNEIQLGLCSVDPASNGLVAYWKLDEGTGSIFHDATKHGYDMDWSNTWLDRDNGQGLVNADKSQYVGWNEDDKNKCIQ